MPAVHVTVLAHSLAFHLCSVSHGMMAERLSVETYQQLLDRWGCPRCQLLQACVLVVVSCQLEAPAPMQALRRGGHAVVLATKHTDPACLLKRPLWRAPAPCCPGPPLSVAR